MDIDPITKFLQLMSKSITNSDLELINLGKTLGLNLVSFAELRASQEDKFVDLIRKKALNRMEIDRDNYLVEKDSFYVGSIDFMVSEDRRFFLLETNGGSHRGLSIITAKQQALLYDGYYEAINQARLLNRRKDNVVLILIGVPINDALIHEKVIMVEYLRKKIKEQGYSVKIFNTYNYNKDFKADFVFLIADYKRLSINLTFSDNWVKYNNEKVSTLIGDGIARRINNDHFKRLIKEDFRKINTLIVNPIFKITDEKALTYLASYFRKRILEKYSLKYLLFTQAFNEEDLVNKLTYAITKYKKSFIIKPSGGSGGAGVMPISKVENIRNIIKESEKEFFIKFMKSRNPYPYTIQEMADFSIIQWRKGKHTFDMRIYLVQSEGKIIPIGGLARIARGEYSGSLNKEEFVVNLSGYNGQIEVERGRAISKQDSKLLNLTINDYVNMFCIGCVLFKSIVENYEKIINFSDWDKLLN